MNNRDLLWKIIEFKLENYIYKNDINAYIYKNEFKEFGFIKNNQRSDEDSNIYDKIFNVNLYNNSTIKEIINDKNIIIPALPLFKYNQKIYGYSWCGLHAPKLESHILDINEIINNIFIKDNIVAIYSTYENSFNNFNAVIL